MLNPRTTEKRVFSSEQFRPKLISHSVNKRSVKAKEQESFLYHQKCMSLADNFKHSME